MRAPDRATGIGRQSFPTMGNEAGTPQPLLHDAVGGAADGARVKSEVIVTNKPVSSPLVRGFARYRYSTGREELKLWRKVEISFLPVISL